MPSKYHMKDVPPERAAKLLKEIMRGDKNSPIFEPWDYKQWTKENTKLMETEKLVHYNIQRLAEQLNEDKEVFSTADEESRFNFVCAQKYSPMVKVGNWQEQRAVAEEDLNRFLRLRQRGELMVQQTREVIGHNLRPVNIVSKKFVKFGDNVQLIARHAKTFRERGKQEGLSLSCVLTGHPTAEMCQPLIEGTLLSASPLIAPCIRNAFQLQPWQGNNVVIKKDDDRLKFGQDFVLRYTGAKPSQPFFVSVNPLRIIPPGNNSHHPEVFLTSRKCWANVWRAYDANPETRDENMGEYIPCNYDVIVTSANVNRSLCCETECWFTTFYGLECEATAYTYYNIYGAEAVNNVWYFV